MEVNIEPLMGLSPIEAIPIVFQELLSEGKIRLQDYAEIGYTAGIVDKCFPTVTKDVSKTIVSLLKLDDEVNPFFFFYLQQEYDAKLQGRIHDVLSSKRK